MNLFPPCSSWALGLEGSHSSPSGVLCTARTPGVSDWGCPPRGSKSIPTGAERRGGGGRDQGLGLGKPRERDGDQLQRRAKEERDHIPD